MENSTFKETNINNYIELLHKSFPTLSTSDIKKIIEYGWRSLYLANLAGCDTLVISTKFNYWFYIGQLQKDSIKHFNYYRRLLIRKILFIYKRIKPDWDGYYYTGLSEEESLYFKTIKKGKKKVNFNFKNKVIFKNKDMCYLFYSQCKCIIKFKYITDVGLTRFYRDLKIKSPEAYFKDPCKFKDILVINNEYDLL